MWTFAVRNQLTRLDTALPLAMLLDQLQSKLVALCSIFFCSLFG